jgi:predicted flap endonuclease-1-like 5' DNA nuclease
MLRQRRRCVRSLFVPPASRSNLPTVHSVSTLAALIAIAIALAIGLVAGARMQRRNTRPLTLPKEAELDEADPPILTLDDSAIAIPAAPAETPASASEHVIDERARIIRSLEAETAMLRRAQAARDAALVQLTDLADDRRRVYAELAAAKGDAARYRQLVVDLEDNAPPPFFGAGAPDDLKLIVGVGPVLERMLQQLGVTTYRQIARWTEHDIDEFDAKLPEFPGRIRRDGWVTQARALHESKYGAAPSARDR